MHLPYQCGSHDESCEQYYRNQAGSGLPVYIGSHGQKGHGIFSSLFRFAIPFLKKAGVGVGRQLLRSGNDLMDDLESGQTLKQSLKRRGATLPHQIINSMTGSGTHSRKRIKRRCKQATRAKRRLTPKRKAAKVKRRRKVSKKHNPHCNQARAFFS